MNVFPDHAAVDYDQRILGLVPGYALALELFGCQLAATLPADCRILVPGCGTGSEILVLADHLPQARFTAIEPSHGMIETARRRIDAAGLSERVDFIHGMLEDTPHTQHHAATLSLVLHFLPDDGSKAAFLQAIARRLHRDGALVLLDAIADGNDDTLAAWLGRQADAGSAAAVLQRVRDQWHRMTTERLGHLLVEQGFAQPRGFFQAPGYLGVISMWQERA